jgi:inositol-phosphate transport system ATP-binding protein
MTDPTPAVVLDEVTKRYGSVVANDRVSLEIRPGEFFSFLGPSGCGKTTLLRIIGGFIAPDGGHVRIGGEDVSAVPPNRRPTNMVFQDYALFPHLDVAGNVGFSLKERRMRKPEIRERVTEALRTVHLEGYERRKPHELSGGQQQRVALARALVNEPVVLLLDEPLGALDLRLRRAMQLELKRIQRDVGITFVYVTHDQEEAMTMSDRIAVMNAGRFEQVGAPEEIYERPQSLFVAGFIGSPPINLLPGEVAGDRLRIDGASLPYEGDARGAVVFGLRPEALRFEAGGLAGRITEVEPMGRETLYLVENDLGTLRVLEAGSSVRHGFGDPVAVAFDADATLIFDRASERLVPGHARMPS